VLPVEAKWKDDKVVHKAVQEFRIEGDLLGTSSSTFSDIRSGKSLLAYPCCRSRSVFPSRPSRAAADGFEVWITTVFLKSIIRP